MSEEKKSKARTRIESGKSIVGHRALIGLPEGRYNGRSSECSVWVTILRLDIVDGKVKVRIRPDSGIGEMSVDLDALHDEETPADTEMRLRKEAAKAMNDDLNSGCSARERKGKVLRALANLSGKTQDLIAIELFESGHISEPTIDKVKAMRGVDACKLVRPMVVRLHHGFKLCDTI